ncbi:MULTISPECIES: adenylyl-sulfate kinase [unclassified Pseudomonas]|uniref:adenylyl-sulfate kinase n=1 Tax=Pseudomonas TaxID=286 RepID=UPI00258090A5|nr:MULTISPECIES: adenylyl-sulfate kinase [unclassified Pseudomonas]
MIKDKNIVWQNSLVLPRIRSNILRQEPVTIWLTGLSGSGKSTIAFALEKALLNINKLAFVLDGDNLRHGLCKDLGFSEEDRSENIRRVAEVSNLMNNAGLITISAFISPLAKDRLLAREIIGKSRFYEVYVNTSLDTCEKRDCKGLYKKARMGLIKDFTGIGSPYEPPIAPDLLLNTEILTIDQCVNLLIEHINLISKDFWPAHL